MKDLLIGRNAVNYAASKTNTAANSATLPSDLALGAVGIYLLGVDGSNAGKTVLVTTANYTTVTTLAGISKSEIQYIFAQGTVDGVIMSKPYKIKEFVREFKREYVAALNQVTYVGYNGVSGSLLGSVVNTFDEATLDFTNRFNQSAPEDEMKSISATLAVGDLAYDIAKKTTDAVNLTVTASDNAGAKYTAETVADGFITGAIAFVGNVTYTNGSSVITVGTSHDVVAGNYIKLVLDPQTKAVTVVAPSLTNSVIYKVLSITATSITLDRAYNGVTTTLSAANAITATVKSASAPSNFGLRITPYSGKVGNEYLQFQMATGGIIKYSPITYSQGINPGSGTLIQVQKLEKEAQIFSGAWSTADGYLPKPVSQIAGTTYDLYFYDVAPIVDTTVASQKGTHFYSLVVAFEDGASVAGQNQFDFDAITNNSTNGIFGSLTAAVGVTVPFPLGDGTPAS